MIAEIEKIHKYIRNQNEKEDLVSNNQTSVSQFSKAYSNSEVLMTDNDSKSVSDIYQEIPTENKRSFSENFKDEEIRFTGRIGSSDATTNVSSSKVNTL